MRTCKNVAFVLRHSSVLYYCVGAAENSHRQGPEVSPSRQACDFEAATGLTTQAQRRRPRGALIAITTARRRSLRECGFMDSTRGVTGRSDIARWDFQKRTNARRTGRTRALQWGLPRLKAE